MVSIQLCITATFVLVATNETVKKTDKYFCDQIISEGINSTKVPASDQIKSLS